MVGIQAGAKEISSAKIMSMAIVKEKLKTHLDTTG